MFSLEEAAMELSSFGLTGNQARAYVALVKLGVASVSQIAQLSKIRREEIYRMMPKLERLGLVEKILGKPVKYKSVPPKDALFILFKRERERAERKMAELAEKQRRLFKQLKSVRAEGTVEEEPRFVLISDRDQALRRMVAMLQKAKKEVSIASSDYGFRLGYGYADALRKALRKGVKARILLEINEIDALTVKMLSEAEAFKDVVEVKHVDNLTFHIVIVDNAEVLLGTFLKPTAEKHVDLWTNSLAYVDAMKAFFDKIWQDSVDIRSRIDYLQTGKPVELTEILRGRDRICERIFAIMAKTRSDLFVMGDAPTLDLIRRNLTSANMELKRRGVRIRILTNINEGNLEVAEEFSKLFEVRHMKEPPTRVLLADNEVGFSWILTKQIPDAAIYSNNNRTVQMMWDIAENAWNNAIGAGARIDEIRKGKPIGRVSKPILEHVLEGRKRRVRRTMEKVVVVRKGEKVETTALKGIRFDLLLKKDVLEAGLNAFEPGASVGLSYKHVGQEVHIILKGEIEFQIEGQKYLLKEGDVICFSSILPHTLRNPGKERAVYFSVVVPPTFM